VSKISKGLASQSAGQQARDGPVNTKGSDGRRDSVPVLEHFGRHEGNPEATADDAQKADRAAAQNVVPQAGAPVDGLHRALEGVVHINSAEIGSQGSRGHGLLQGLPLKDIDGRKDDGTDRARLDRVGQASLLIGPAPGVDIEEHFVLVVGM